MKKASTRRARECRRGKTIYGEDSLYLKATCGVMFPEAGATYLPLALNQAPERRPTYLPRGEVTAESL